MLFWDCLLVTKIMLLFYWKDCLQTLLKQILWCTISYSQVMPGLHHWRCCMTTTLLMIATAWYKGWTPNMHVTLCDRDHHLNLLRENFEFQFPVAWGIACIYLAAWILISGSTTKAFWEEKKCVKTTIFLFEPGSHSVLHQMTGLNTLHTSQDCWAQYDQDDLWDKTECRQNHGWYLICNICFIKEQLLLILLFSMEYSSHVSRNVWCNPNSCLIHYLYI